MGLIRDKLHIMNDDYDPKRFVKTAAGYAYRRVVMDPSESLRLPFAIKKFESEYRKTDPKSIDQLLDFAFNFRYFGVSIMPGQDRWEIGELLKIVKERQPMRMMEIGTYLGGTLFLFSNVLPKSAHIISLDLPHGEWRMGYPEVRGALFRKFAVGNQKIDLIQINSHTAEALDAVKSALGGPKLDFLFIDGDHTADGVKKDFEMYSPLVEKGGTIAFHDVGWSHVHDYWNLIKRGRNTREFISEKSPGIGIIFV